ncbi:MAG TPA: hypothetical protein VIM41_16485 [Gammaproteobacteria bacterium]
MSKKSKTWYGYLDAGTKSSPVLMDPKLDTGNPNTVYLYNLNRGKILEYQKAIIEPKLRELNGKESDIADELKKAYNKARKDFTPRRSPGKTNSESSAAGPAGKKVQIPDLELESIGGDDVEINAEIELDDDE